MKQIVLLITGLFIINITYGQTLKIQVGTSLSTLDWKLKSYNLEAPYEDILIGYSIFFGVDYLNYKFFNLSSNTGFLSRGGKGEIGLTNEIGEPISTTIEKPTLDYFSINTKIDFKYPLKEKVIPYLSFGPRFDYLISYSNHFNGLKEMDELENYSYGLVIGGGIKYNLSNIQIGLIFDYYLDFSKIADWPVEPGNLGGEVTGNTSTINFIIGYRIN